MKIRPLGDKIVVKRLETVKVSPGGIYIPPTATEKPTEGLVVAVGAGKVDSSGHLHEPRVKVGDKILFGKYTGTEIKIEDVDHLIMNESDILGVIES